MSSLFVICNSALYGYVFLTLLGLIQPDPATIIRYIAVFGTELPILGSALNPVIINSEERSNKFEKTVFEQSKCRIN